MTLDDDVAARLEREVRATGKSFKTVLNETLRQALARPRKAAAIAPFVLEARELGVHPGLDYSDTESLLEVAEGPEHR